MGSRAVWEIEPTTLLGETGEPPTRARPPSTAAVACRTTHHSVVGRHIYATDIAFYVISVVVATSPPVVSYRRGDPHVAHGPCIRHGKDGSFKDVC